MNINKIYKKVFFLITIIYTGVCFASVVSDNDGKAFISKAEFDSLKNTFQSQIDAYNKNIDATIDNAIASYLSGISMEKETNLENKYQKINPTWMKDKRFNKSKKGTKYTAYMSFVEAALATNFFSYIFEGTGDSWYGVKDMTYNIDEQEYLYRISKKKIGKFSNKYSLQDLVKSDYTVTVVGGAAGFRGGAYDVDGRLLFFADTTFRKGTNIYFSTWYDTLPIEIWEVNNSNKTKTSYIGNVGGSTGNGEEVAISMVASDIVEEDETLFYLAGGSLVNDVMYCLDSEDTSLLGDMFETADSNHGSTRQASKNDAGTGISQKLSWTYTDYSSSHNYDSGMHAEVYRHKLTELNSVNLLNEIITQNTNIETYYYSGCPLFTATADAEVKFKIKFKNTESAKTKWALKDGLFENTANPGNAENIEECSETTFLADNDEIITVKFKVKKNKTYWIKAEPESGYSIIEFDGNIVQTDNEK